MFGQKDENGKIRNLCSLKLDDFEELPDGANVGDFVKDGKSYTPPNSYSVLSAVTGDTPIWIADIDAIRSAKLSEISAAYLAERTTANKGITSAALVGVIIDCRESDVINIQNLVTLLEAQGKSDYFYKLKDNTSVDCTVAQIKAVLTELIAALLSMWQLKQTLTEQINAATTAEEIQAITWAWTQS